MSEDGFKVQWSVSLPPAAQYAKGDMLNIRGESVAEVEALFDAALGGNFVQKASEVAALIRAAATVTEGLSESQPPAFAQSEAAQAQAAPAASTNNVTPLYTCTHGKRVKREGDKNGKHWVGHFCPQPRGAADQCKAVFED